MREKERVIFNTLDKAMPQKIFFLPYTDSFRFLVTVILSQSSTDKMAEKSASRLFEAFPDALSLACIDVESIETLIHSSGLSVSKSRTIKETAVYFLEHGEHETREELLSIKGIGEKTASVYEQRVLGGNAVVVDTHFERVSYRLGLSTTHERNKTMREIMEKFDSPLWNRLSDTLNYLGRTICRPSPKCEECILKESCIKRIE